MSILSLDSSGANAMLDGLAQMLGGGSIEILSADLRPLATLRLSDPAAPPANNGELVLARIEEDLAPQEGTATFARILASDGNEVFSCDVGTLESDAVIKLSSTAIHRGSPISIRSFKLSMPQ